MTEPTPKKELSADQIEQRRVNGMSDRQMLNRVKNIARTSRTNIDATWAIVLSTILENTKPLGRMEPFLR